MNFFIIGGAGFIGSHFANQQLNNSPNNSVTIYDNLSSGSLHHVSQISAQSRLRFIKEDAKDLDALVKAMRAHECVVHLAANPDISKAVNNPAIDFWEGTYLTNNVLEAMRINEIGYLIYTSGSGVYGERVGERFSENFGPCIPISTYGASKLASESLIAAYCSLFGIRARCFRFANVVGPGQTHGVGFDFLNKLKCNPSRLEILGDGKQIKSYVHIEDVLTAVEVIIRNDLFMQGTPCFDTFNVSNDCRVTVLEIAEVCCEVLGLQLADVEFVFTAEGRGWPGDVPNIQLDSSKIRGKGWGARYTSRSAIFNSILAMARA